MKINNYRKYSPKISKTRLKKCDKGLHEFIKKPTKIIDKHTITAEEWSCRHCGLLMNSRSNSFYKN
jgi:hypothetical protein